jgi:hypothetical protein
MMTGFRSAIIFLIALNLTAKNELGLGIAVGDPTGITAKYWTSRNTAICGACGWSFRSEGYLHINGDFIYHYFNLFPVEKGELPLYFGLGGRLALKDETEIGVRIPVGIAYIFSDAPFDAFFELSPYLNLYPRTDMFLSASLGGRFFFDL